MIYINSSCSLFSVHKGMIDTKVTQVSEFTFDKVVNATFGR